jgi:hypothetical protein
MTDVAKARENDTGAPPPLHVLFGEDWNLVCTSGVNVLVHAPAAVAGEVINALRSQLRPPILVALPGRPLPLGSIDEGGTLVVYDIPDLTAADQQRLLVWMDRVPRRLRRTRVISTATRSVVPLIEWGIFRADLYYRLNALYLDVRRIARGSRHHRAP